MAAADLRSLTLPQLGIVLDTAVKQRSDLDAVLVEKLKSVEAMQRELEHARKEVRLHQRRESLRRGMEQAMKGIDKEIEALHTEKMRQKEEYEAKIRAVDEVRTPCTTLELICLAGN